VYAKPITIIVVLPKLEVFTRIDIVDLKLATFRASAGTAIYKANYERVHAKVKESTKKQSLTEETYDQSVTGRAL
jgi:hypothetical protein